MILEKEKYMDRLFWFNWFKQNYSRYTVIQKEKLKEHGGENAEYFASLHSVEDKLQELGQKVLSEISTNSKELPKKDLITVFTYMQYYLDKVYDRLEEDFSNDLPTRLIPVIPTIQNTIRKAVNTDTGKIKELTFESWFFDKEDIVPCLFALRDVKPAIINEKYEYLLGLHDKSAITAWVSILHKFNYVRHPGDELTAPIINAKIKNLNVSGKTLRTPNGKAYTQYIKDFQFLIPLKK